MALVSEFKNDRQLFRNAVQLIKVLVNSDEGKKCLAQGTGENELLKVFTYEDPKVLNKRRKRLSPAERRRAKKSFCHRHKLREPYRAARNFYLAERKEDLLAKYPDGEKTQKELNEIASKEWESFSDEKRDEYEHIKEAKWHEFYEAVRNADDTGESIKLWIKEKPKYIISGYLLFCNDHRDAIRKKNPEAKMGEVAKLLSVEWKKLKKSKKEHYEKLGNENKAKRDAELASSKNQNTNTDNDNETDQGESSVTSPETSPCSSPVPSPDSNKAKKNKKDNKSNKKNKGNKKGNKNSDDSTLSD